MKLNCGYVFKGLDGRDVMEPDNSGNLVPMTVAKVLAPILVTPDPKEQDGMKKARQYGLAVQVYKEQEIEIDDKDVALIKDLVGRFCPPIAVGQIFELLENK